MGNQNGVLYYERKVWRYLYQNGEESERIRRESDRLFRKAFPEGHCSSIRNYLLDLAEQVEGGDRLCNPFHNLNDIHPRAWSILLAYGKDYRPYCWRGISPHLDAIQPEAGKCCDNTLKLLAMCKDSNGSRNIATYVEGVAMGPLVRPMLHAWNGKGFSREAVDWTFYGSTRWTRYFGIPFTLNEYRRLVTAASPRHQYVRLIFRKDCFDQVEEELHKVLKRPRTRLVSSAADQYVRAQLFLSLLTHGAKVRATAGDAHFLDDAAVAAQARFSGSSEYSQLFGEVATLSLCVNEVLKGSTADFNRFSHHVSAGFAERACFRYFYSVSSSGGTDLGAP